MEEVESAFHALDQLCLAIKAYSISAPRTVYYRAPVIDHFHPDGYGQRAIAGLSRFLSHAQAERDYVEGILRSGHAPVDFTTNAPNLLAVWDEVINAPGPISLVSQMLDLDPANRRAGQIKLDVIADGGNEWIKVSTMKEARLMAEFREQDSYVNSDYDSDSEFEAGPDGVPTPRNRAPAELTNSLISQTRTLVNAARIFRRPQGLPQPRIRFVLNRMSEHEEYADGRIERTFEIIRGMGVNLVIGNQPRSSLSKVDSDESMPIPTTNILLDMSVLVALCCDSAHHRLPANTDELESRFRALRRTESGLGLAEHNNVTRDLRDQLQWEMEHSLIGEMQAQLAKTLDQERDQAGGIQFWVTEEVKGRLPNIVDIIGGHREKARAAAMFEEGNEGLDFWQHSRWKGKAPALGNMKVKILPRLLEDPPDLDKLSLEDGSQASPSFHTRLMKVCENMLAPPPTSQPPPTPLHKQKFRQSKNPKRPYNYYPTTTPASSRAPSPHTLNSFVAASSRGWTVLTNNRGAVSKVMRDMGVMDGLPYDKAEERARAVVWVVNPSSLSEWRRLEVEESNRALQSEGAASGAA